MPLLKPTRQVGPINFIRLDQVPTSYKWTATLTSDDRLFVHPAGTAAGYYCSPDVIPVAEHDAAKVTSGVFGVDQIPTIQNAKLGTGLSRAKLANNGGLTSSASTPTVTSASFVLKYTLSLGTIPSGVARIAWGFSASAGTTHDSTVGLKSVDVYAAFKSGLSQIGSTRAMPAGFSGTNSSSGQYGAGGGTAAWSGYIVSPAAGSASVEIYARINVRSGSASIDGQLFGADAWWTEI